MTLKLGVGIILSVRKLDEKRRLKDIQTKNENFIANGVVVHNCHHASAGTYSFCVGSMRARYKYGCTATPYRTDDLDRIFLDHFGGVAFRMKDLSLIPKVWVSRIHLGLDLRGCYSRTGEPNLTRIINQIVKSDMYNDLLVERAVFRLSEGRQVLLLSHRVPHCEMLAKRMGDMGHDATVITGKVPRDKREGRYGHRFIAATYKCMAEGIDIPPLSSVIFGTPFGAPMMVEQGGGRVQREHPGKPIPTVDDFMLSDHKMLIALFYKRRNVYKKLGWPITTQEIGPRCTPGETPEGWGDLAVDDYYNDES